MAKSAGSLTRLLGRFLLLSGLGIIRRLLLPKFLSASRPKGDSRLTTGWSILDLFLASAAAFEISSAFKRASVHGLIFTAPGFFFFGGSSPTVFLPKELTDPVSGGTTSNWRRDKNSLFMAHDINISFVTSANRVHNAHKRKFCGDIISSAG
ncbi:hypothetical protein EUGRSUZ_G02470 [Eucalyptus grandis]|uniref:Uncharacterized protein n=2 Tax=Eucalyptus grandis TaxID=71139 RepID=A0ACC3K8P4_EUCGR|nr:hypothetical protein EUGRSUZ_G02470 [Eucalyptus grandis]